MRLSKFLSDLSRKTGPLLDCNDTLIDSTVNEMFGRFVSCRPGLGRSYWLAASLGNPTHHRSKTQSCLVSRRTMTSVLILIAFVFNLYVQKFLKKYRLRSLSYDKPSKLVLNKLMYIFHNFMMIVLWQYTNCQHLNIQLELPPKCWVFQFELVEYNLCIKCGSISI